MAKSWIQEIDGDGVGLRVLGADLAAGKDFEEFAYVVAVAHAGVVGRIEGLKDGGRGAFGEAGEEVDFGGDDDEVWLDVVLLGAALEGRKEEEGEKEGRSHVRGDCAFVVFEFDEFACSDSGILDYGVDSLEVVVGALGEFFYAFVAAEIQLPDFDYAAAVFALLDVFFGFFGFFNAAAC